VPGAVLCAGGLVLPGTPFAFLPFLPVGFAVIGFHFYQSVHQTCCRFSSLLFRSAISCHHYTPLKKVLDIKYPSLYASHASESLHPSWQTHFSSELGEIIGYWHFRFFHPFHFMPCLFAF